MTITRVQGTPAGAGSRRFVGAVGHVDAGHRRVALARIVTTGSAARIDRRDSALAQAVLVAALDALRERGLSVTILVTPAGFVDHKPGGEWSGTTGWQTTQADFDRLAAVAASVARELVTPEVRRLALGTVGHLIVGVDVWPTAHREPHAEVACDVDIASGRVVAVTGKTYPNTQQQEHLIRNPDVGSHIVRIDNERVAVLVCHDLAAWSPRGNAVAQDSRAKAWQAMQAGVAGERPTLAVQLTHTLNTAATWRSAWSRLAARSGGALRGGTSAIRHLDQHWHEVAPPPDAKLLAGTGRGERAIDLIVTEVGA